MYVLCTVFARDNFLLHTGGCGNRAIPTNFAHAGVQQTVRWLPLHLSLMCVEDLLLSKDVVFDYSFASSCGHFTLIHLNNVHV